MEKQRTGSLGRKIGRLFARLVPPGVPVPILRGPMKGLKIISGALAGEGKGLSPVFNLYEPAQLAFASQVIRRESICFDIGANVGLYTLLFAARGKQVVAFEPIPRNIQFLSRTVAINQLDNVTIMPCAVSSSSRLVKFAGGINWAEGKISEDGSQPAVAISCDDFVRTYETIPEIIKIDVEGAELDVLHGAQVTLTTHRPVLLLSTHSNDLRDQCFELLREYGYTGFMNIGEERRDESREYAINA
jgi:FkbM family methyltransferase